MKVTVGTFPWPYKAAMAICSDIDGATLPDFLAIHEFLNTDRFTPMGRGLRLPLADSFWFYQHPEASDRAFTYFDGLSGRESPAAGVIRDAIREGWIDTLHTWGNFSRTGGFSRAMAERAAEEMDRQGLRIAVWTNHGDDNNAQNIGGPPPWTGDAPHLSGSRNPAYHVDILRRAGIRFFQALETDLTPVIGQERPCSLVEAYVRSPYAEGPLQPWKEAAKGGLTVLNRVWRAFTGRYLNRWDAFTGNNRLLWPHQLRDGQGLVRFRRMGSGRRDWCEDLAWLLRSAVLDRLVASGGAGILYVHWTDRKRREGGPPFPPDVVAAFEALAARYHDGQIWVASTSQLLRHVALTRNLELATQWDAAGGELRILTIVPQWVYDCLDGNVDASGLVLQCDGGLPRRLWINGEERRFDCRTSAGTRPCSLSVGTKL